MKQFLAVLILVFTLISTPAFSQSFYVSDIRVEGLQRVSAHALFSEFPINVGDEVNSAILRRATSLLFRTGNFDDIELLRDGDVLIIKVVERPSISSIKIAGNETLPTEVLMNALKQSGLSEGEIFKRATLDRIHLELERQYTGQGRYGAKIVAEVKEESRNRVALSINITEGDVASILHINILGNKVFSDAELLDNFELSTPGFWSFFKKDDLYAREKLSGDLETLRSYYLDRGYINFSIESTQVTISPDKQDVYLTVNIVEGEKYTVSDVKVAGELPVDEVTIKALIVMRPGAFFSNRMVTASSDLISKRLGNEGYIFAKVNGIPDVNEEDKTVDITFFVDPGERTYVRRINFVGNTKTADEVLRREMRQMEGAWASGHQIEQSKARLNRLGFFKEVDVDTPRVPGTRDQIDVNYVVEEGNFGELSASVGYSGGSGGLILSASLSQNNFLGSGNRVSVGLNRSEFQDNYNFSFDNPYYTVDGVSRGFNLFFRETDYEEGNGPSTVTNSFGGAVTYGYPISEIERLRFSFGYTNTEILQRSDTFFVAEIRDFLEEQDNFDTITATGAWSKSTLNRGLFPDRGASQTFGLEVSLPGISELEYFRLSYSGQKYYPLSSILPKQRFISGADSWALRFKTELGFGDGYGDSEFLPFFQHYRSGGFGSVHGYRQNTLGPKSSEIAVFNPVTTGLVCAGLSGPADINGNIECVTDQDPFGGNVLIEASAELIFPVPFVKDKRSFRSAFFLDTGNVFDSKRRAYNVTTRSFDGNEFNPDFNELRYSFGFGLTWVTAIAPLSFVVAVPFGDEPEDSTKTFQFELGRVF